MGKALGKKSCQTVQNSDKLGVPCSLKGIVVINQMKLVVLICCFFWLGMPVFQEDGGITWQQLSSYVPANKALVKGKNFLKVKCPALFQETAQMKLGLAAEISEMDRFGGGKEDSSVKKSCIKRKT